MRTPFRPQPAPWAPPGEPQPQGARLRAEALLPARPFARVIEERLRAEVGAIPKQAPLRIALTYPSPYAVGMSSLGFQRMYRAIQETDGMMCERAFLPDDAVSGERGERPVTYESRTPLA